MAYSGPAEVVWRTFYFDGNQAWGLIDSPAQWERIKEEYRVASKSGSCASPSYMLSARNCPVAEHPRFGFVVECNGPQTLGEFFEEHGMDVGPL